MNASFRLGAAIGLILISSAPALAQSAQPYTPGGVGMSQAYRQAILNDALLGSRPSALIRGPSGLLLDVERRDRQVFLRSPNSGAFLAGARPNAGWPTGLGTGLGWGGVPSGGSAVYAPGVRNAGDSMTHWIAMLPAGEGQSNWAGLASRQTSSPTDAWIRLL